MTHDSNSDAFTPWGERASPTANDSGLPMAWMTVPALLRHIVLMLTVSSALTLLNLIATPRVWWSFAILVIWVAVVAIHAIGLFARSLLIEDTADEPRPRPRAQVEEPAREAGPPVPAWLNLPKPWRGQRQPEAPISWALPDDDGGDAWPAPPTTTERHPQAPERVPWREATDIAWLRRPSRGDTPADPDHRGTEASS